MQVLGKIIFLYNQCQFISFLFDLLFPVPAITHILVLAIAHILVPAITHIPVVVEASDPQRERRSHPSSRSNIRRGESHFLVTGILTPPPIDGRPSSSMSQSLEGTLYPLSAQSREATKEFRHPSPIRTHP